MLMELPFGYLIVGFLLGVTVFEQPFHNFVGCRRDGGTICRTKLFVFVACQRKRVVVVRHGEPRCRCSKVQPNAYFIGAQT